MRAFVIQVVPEASVGHVSQEGYTTLEKAQAFIETRADKPKQVTPMHYRSGGKVNGVWEDYVDYFIHDVKIV